MNRSNLSRKTKSFTFAIGMALGAALATTPMTASAAIKPPNTCSVLQNTHCDGPRPLSMFQIVFGSLFM